MKVLFRTFIVLAMIFSMAACDEKTVYEPEDDSQWAPVVDPEEDEEEPEDQGKEEDEGKEEETPQKKDTIKVMSFNIRTGTSDKGTSNAWDNRKPGVYEMIKTEKPLIVGLQECHIFQRDDITSNCPDYAGFGIGRDNASETSGESCSVIYNKNLCSIEKWGSFWLSPTPDKVSIGWDAAYNRKASAGTCCRLQLWSMRDLRLKRPTARLLTTIGVPRLRSSTTSLCQDSISLSSRLSIRNGLE